MTPVITSYSIHYTKLYESEIDELRASIAAKKIEIETAKVAVEKYKSQQDNVRNNREYDFLSKEIEFQTLEIELCEKRIKEFTAEEKDKNQELRITSYNVCYTKLLRFQK